LCGLASLPLTLNGQLASDVQIASEVVVLVNRHLRGRAMPAD
jgi:hypothetical protein